jgi:regulator of nucleoside diphosphate kinase
MTQHSTIYITKTDNERLGHLIRQVRDGYDTANQGYINRLEEELEYAEVVPSEQIPPDVVTMRSRVELTDLDTDEKMVYSIVFPTEANSDEGQISILAPIATAVLGYRRGDEVEFQAPARLRRLKIEDILYQPESAGDLDS